MIFLDGKHLEVSTLNSLEEQEGQTEFSHLVANFTVRFRLQTGLINIDPHNERKVFVASVGECNCIIWIDETAKWAQQHR
jgi:hypothetical protein